MKRTHFRDLGDREKRSHHGQRSPRRIGLARPAPVDAGILAAAIAESAECPEYIQRGAWRCRCPRRGPHDVHYYPETVATR